MDVSFKCVNPACGETVSRPAPLLAMPPCPYCGSSTVPAIIRKEDRHPLRDTVARIATGLGLRPRA